MPRVCSLFLCAALSILAAGPSAAADDNQDAAIHAAMEWLVLVDEGRYGESWEEAAAYFRNAVTKGDWEVSLKATRRPLGALKTRFLTSATSSTSLPGAPDGEYVVMEFAAVFENKVKAMETVTPMKESDGSWRVSGYFIR